MSNTYKPSHIKRSFSDKVICVIAIIAMLLCLVVSGAVLFTVIKHTNISNDYQSEQPATVEKSDQNNEVLTHLSAQDGSHAGENAVSYEEVAPEQDGFPTYLQTDKRWCDVPYGTGTIGTNGCGLTCAAMVMQHITGKKCTPLDLSKMADSEMLTDGINDIEKMTMWIAVEVAPDHSIQTMGPLQDSSWVYPVLQEDWILFGSCFGQIGDFETSESGHIVIIYEADENGYYIRDPYCESNNRIFTEDEFNSITWSHFYGLRDANADYK